MEINDNPNYEGWVDVYKKIINWELKLNSSDNQQMKEILDMQKQEAKLRWMNI